MKHNISMASDLTIHLQDYGIEVPLFDTRVQQVIEELQKDEILFQKFLQIKRNLHTTPLSFDYVALAHDLSYTDKLRTDPDQCVKDAYELVKPNGEYHRFNPKLAKYSFDHFVQHVLKAADGVVQSAHLALQDGFCFYLNSYGGAHHAMSFGGRGFCLMNDIVIAIRQMQSCKKIKNAWVIDTDAHKGDGTAELTKNDKTIETLSIHMAKGWPLDNLFVHEPYWIPSTVDIPIEAGEESEYLRLLANGLERLQKQTKKPDFAVVVNGSDPYIHDVLPSASLLKLDEATLLARDVMVYNFLRENEIPQLWLMAGGYGHEVFKIYLQFLKFILKQ